MKSKQITKCLWCGRMIKPNDAVGITKGNKGQDIPLHLRCQMLVDGVKA